MEMQKKIAQVGKVHLEVGVVCSGTEEWKTKWKEGVVIVSQVVQQQQFSLI